MRKSSVVINKTPYTLHFKKVATMIMRKINQKLKFHFFSKHLATYLQDKYFYFYSHVKNLLKNPHLLKDTITIGSRYQILLSSDLQTPYTPSFKPPPNPTHKHLLITFYPLKIKDAPPLPYLISNPLLV